MRKTFKYRLYPTGRQSTAMNGILTECRWLYNQFLEQRKVAWETECRGLSYYEQTDTIPPLKQARPSLNTIHSQVLQNVAMRIDLAFKAFFRRCKAGEKPGYPRFRGKERYDSFCYPQLGFRLTEDGLSLSKIGKVRIKQHRLLAGTVKTCTITRKATGKWYACFSCEIDPEPLPVSTESMGIDVGLTNFAVLSNGQAIENPRFFRTDQQALAKAQRKLSMAPKGSPERNKRRKVVALVHERIADRRNNFAHQHSRRFINRYGMLAVEDLSVNQMLHNNCLAKSISDAAWSMFTSFLTYKAACAGRTMLLVNPAYTSQDCSQCGHRVPKMLSDRVHRCPCCGLSMDRDENAARNILALGMQSLA